jgi:hypothetical protein
MPHLKESRQPARIPNVSTTEEPPFDFKNQYELGFSTQDHEICLVLKISQKV